MIRHWNSSSTHFFPALASLWWVLRHSPQCGREYETGLLQSELWVVTSPDSIIAQCFQTSLFSSDLASGGRGGWNLVLYCTVIKHSGHLRTLEKCRKHSPAARVFYISLVFSNVRRARVLSHGNTWLRLLHLLNKVINNWRIREVHCTTHYSITWSELLHKDESLFWGIEYQRRHTGGNWNSHA